MAVSRTESICKEIHESVGEQKEKAVTRLLLSLTPSESRKVRQSYLKIYGDDLIQIVQKLDPRLSTMSCSMLLDPFERDAGFAREAIYRNGAADYKALVEIFATRKSSHFLLIRQAYAAKYRSQLELDIAAIEPRHSYQKILMALSASHKAHHADISQDIGKCDAKRLYQTGEAKGGAVDEAIVLEILSKRSISQLNLAFFSYKHIFGHSYTKFLKNRGVGEFEDAVRVVAECIYSPPRYYAKKSPYQRSTKVRARNESFCTTRQHLPQLEHLQCSPIVIRLGPTPAKGFWGNSDIPHFRNGSGRVMSQVGTISQGCGSRARLGQLVKVVGKV